MRERGLMTRPAIGARKVKAARAKSTPCKSIRRRACILLLSRPMPRELYFTTLDFLMKAIEAK